MTTTTRTARPWLLRPPSDDARALLFCLPYSGTGASMYRNWPRRLAGDIEVCPVQLPGREGRIAEPVPGSYEELAEALIDGVADFLDRPYALFGHCGSALASFEVASQLAGRGLPTPTRVIVSSQVAPQDCPFGRILTMSDDDLAGEVADLMRAMGGTPIPEMVELSCGVLRTDVEVFRRYRRETPYRQPFGVTALGWADDVEVPFGRMGGWSAWADTREVVLPGGHLSFLAGGDELLAELAADLT